VPVKKQDIENILGWTYEEPYSFYNIGHEKEVIEELLDGSYYVMKNEKGEIVSFYCFGKAAQVSIDKQCDVYMDKDIVDIGLGMRPDLTGQGKGIEFLTRGLAFAREKFSTTKFRLTVATFNQRAIKVYEKAGFKKEKVFKVSKKKWTKSDVEFMTMKLNCKI